MGISNRGWFVAILLFLIAERLMEIKSADRNFRRLTELGGREFGASHYFIIVAMHSAFFVSLAIEFVSRGFPLAPFWPFSLAIFILAQGLRLWTRRAMGERWTTRIVVIPGERLIASGPFRFLRHPIYLAVALELFSVPLIFGLYATCIVFTVLNALMLLRVRIPTERAALAWTQDGKQ
jgi:methyltransferase